MKERIPLNSEESELSSIREHLSQKLSEIYNEFTEAPVNLPYRNVIKELLSAAGHLTSGSGTTRTRAQAAQTKIDLAVAEIQQSQL